MKPRDWLRTAYAGGVPMGGDLSRAEPAGERRAAPRFLVWAARDPNGAPLERAQIVKIWLEGETTREQVFDVAQGRATELAAVARRLGVTVGQLAIAWCACNPRVSTVITGASTVSQVHENLKALDALAQLTPEVLAEIAEIVSPFRARA